MWFLLSRFSCTKIYISLVILKRQFIDDIARSRKSLILNVSFSLSSYYHIDRSSFLVYNTLKKKLYFCFTISPEINFYIINDVTLPSDINAFKIFLWSYCCQYVKHIYVTKQPQTGMLKFITRNSSKSICLRHYFQKRVILNVFFNLNDIISHWSMIISSM